jgi:hypothetical protein
MTGVCGMEGVGALWGPCVLGIHAWQAFCTSLSTVQRPGGRIERGWNRLDKSSSTELQVENPSSMSGLFRHWYLEILAFKDGSAPGAVVSFLGFSMTFAIMRTQSEDHVPKYLLHRDWSCP